MIKQTLNKIFGNKFFHRLKVIGKYSILKPFLWLLGRIALILLCLYIGFNMGAAYMHDLLGSPRCDYEYHYVPPTDNPKNIFNKYRKWAM